MALSYLDLKIEVVQAARHWALRYAILLWLSLICKIPFNLAQFDESDEIGRTADRLEGVGKGYLDRAGLEREGAAVLLSQLYTR